MLYALLGILIFAMVGIVIFNAATSNLARFRREQKVQQSYLAVSSAADVFIDSIAGDKVTYTIRNNVTDSITWEYVPYGSATPKTSGEIDFSNILMGMVRGTIPNSIDLTMSAKLDDKTLEDINIKLTMNNYDLKAVFTNSSSDSDVQYYLTAYIPFVTDDTSTKAPVLIENYYDNTNTLIQVYKIEWDTGNVYIERGNN